MEVDHIYILAEQTWRKQQRQQSMQRENALVNEEAVAR